MPYRTGAARAGGLSPSARARGETCQLSEPSQLESQLRVSAGVPVLAATGEEVQHSGVPRARAMLR